MTHNLKVLRRFYEPLLFGSKTFEIRRDDRAFCEGDTLHLEEWEPSKYHGGSGTYTSRVLDFLVTYCLREQPYVPQGYVCMGIKFIKVPTE